MSLFSAIITTRNRKELLKKAIESVLSQTVKDVECVVVDDASEDGTKETYEKDPRIVYVRIDAKDSRGGNYARNQGIAHACIKNIPVPLFFAEGLSEKLSMETSNCIR